MQGTVITLPTSTWLSSQKGTGLALACWVLIVPDVGLPQPMDGGKTWKSEVNCSDQSNTMRKNLSQMTSTLPGPSVPNTMTTGSMLRQTKNSVGFCYVIPYHRKKESNYIPPPWWLECHLFKNSQRFWHGHGSAYSAEKGTGFYLSRPPGLVQGSQQRWSCSQVLPTTSTCWLLHRICAKLVPTPVLESYYWSTTNYNLTNKSWSAII